ncbi:MAG: hypothetical protein QOJ27_131, partial [Sphingomonadales bacterium]|nr:hypothetical protein [Sphingomonadales bacterium]
MSLSPAKGRLDAFAGLLGGSARTTQLKAMARDLNAGAVVQRFQVAENGDKTSDGGQLFLHGKHDLYAGAAQFEQVAELSPNVEFQSGEARGDLHRVIPRLRDDTDFAGEAAEWDGAIDRPAMKRDTESRHAVHKRMDTLLPELMEENADELDPEGDAEEYRANYRADAFSQASDELDEGALAADELDDEHPAVRALDAYIAEQGADRILLPSSCIEAAKIIAGRNPGATVDRAPGPGDMIQYVGDQNAPGQWPFHVATTIMTDESDYVTLENAAPKEDDDVSKLKLDRSWYFAMYGAAAEQSFKAAYA